MPPLRTVHREEARAAHYPTQPLAPSWSRGGQGEQQAIKLEN